MRVILALSYAAIATGVALLWWRRSRLLGDDSWIGPALRHWQVARRLAQCISIGTILGFASALVLACILGMAGRTEDAEYMTQLLLITFPWVLACQIVAGALDGPSSATAAGRANLEIAKWTGTVRYVGRDWFFRIVGPLVLLIVVALAASTATLPSMAVDQMPAATSWALAAAALLGLAVGLGSTVVRAEIAEGRLRGHTLLRLRSFDYSLREVQISFRVVPWPARELLLVSHMRWWPLLFSSNATDYEPLCRTLLHEIMPFESGPV